MRAPFIVTLAALLSASASYAQEGAGAGRVEISGFPGGGIFFGRSATDTEPDFGNYTIGAAVTWNFNRWIGIEGEAGSAVGVSQSIDFNGERLARQHSPCFFGYNASVIVNPFGNDQALVPYAAGGFGVLRMLRTEEAADLGVTTPTNFVTGIAGGGLKWFATNHWGARADYRLVVVNDTADAPAFFGRDGIRYGHRVYGGLLFTY